MPVLCALIFMQFSG